MSVYYVDQIEEPSNFKISSNIFSQALDGKQFSVCCN